MKIKVKAEIKVETLPYDDNLNNGILTMCQAFKFCPTNNGLCIGCLMCNVVFNIKNTYNKENYNKLMKKLKNGEIKDER